MAGLYIHVPFCKTRCAYCDFYSSTHSEQKKAFIHALCKELEMRADYLLGQPIHTVYFGGGTPSQLSPAEFERVFNTIERIYGMGQCEEVTIEANPDDLTPRYTQQLSALPINRLSVGIQTFNNDILKRINRRHNAKQATDAIRTARRYGFDNISIDLIYGLPEETSEIFSADLDWAIGLDVEHISAYHLTYEEGTPIYKQLQQNVVAEADEELSEAFFHTLLQRLNRAGYMHYEISNFCRPGKYSRHNRSYWNGTHYLGCGPSAHSYNGTSREWNVANLNAYLRGIEGGERSFEREELERSTAYNDLIVTSLRTTWGVSLRKVEECFGASFKAYLLREADKYLRAGILEQSGNYIRLTPKGIFVSDGVLSALMWVE